MLEAAQIARHLQKPMSNRERNFAQKHRIFLMRNMERIRRMNDKRLAPPIEKEKESDFVKENVVSKTGKT